MSINMIERVARAIRHSRNPTIFPKWDDLDIKIKLMYYKEAKAAIEAMREPTEEMIELFNDHDWIDRYWEPAIDAALKDDGLMNVDNNRAS